jgi:hypothetical protein
LVNIPLLGIPHDDNSSFMKGPSEAPPLVRRELLFDAYSSGANRELTSVRLAGSKIMAISNSMAPRAVSGKGGSPSGKATSRITADAMAMTPNEGHDSL